MLALGLPILGICYGLQFLTHHLGGKVRPADKREYGPAQVSIVPGQQADNPLFAGLPASLDVWMSHGDEALELPPGFSLTARTANAVAGIADPARNIWAVQFHPEVRHTPRGTELLRNFLFRICHAEPNWTPAQFIQSTVAAIREQVGDGHAICALSGGVDSSVAAVLVERAIGHRLTCVFVNNGVLRKNEFLQVQRNMRDKLGLQLVAVDASERFLARLAGVTDPEAKRKIIGSEFIAVFDDEAKRILEGAAGKRGDLAGAGNALPGRDRILFRQRAVPDHQEPSQRRRFACHHEAEADRTACGICLKMKSGASAVTWRCRPRFWSASLFLAPGSRCASWAR